MRNNTLFGIAAIIASLGYTFKQAPVAYADMGPNVSLGSNPIFMEHGTYTTSSNSATVDALTSPTNQDAVVVRVRIDCNTNTRKTIQTSQGLVLYNHNSEDDTEISYDRLGIVIRAGESLQIVHSQYSSGSEDCTWFAMGYYMHP